MLVRKNARHDALDVTIQYARHVGDGFTLAKAYLLRANIDRMPAKMLHTHFEGNAGAQTGLLEHHRQRFAFQDGLVATFLVVGFELDRQLKQGKQFSRAMVCDSQEIFHNLSVV